MWDHFRELRSASRAPELPDEPSLRHWFPGGEDRPWQSDRLIARKPLAANEFDRFMADDQDSRSRVRGAVSWHPDEGCATGRSRKANSDSYNV